METTATLTLSDAIEKLYDVFAVYPLNAPVTGCPHCTTPEDYARLESKPLRELSDDDLEKYAYKSLTTWGGIEDFKHFLPRLFELIAWHGEVGSTWPEVVFGKLPYSKSRGGRWSEVEQQAIESFCFAWWQTTLDSYGNRKEGFTCLECIGQCVDDISPFLTVWRNDTSLSALRHIVDFVNYGSYITTNSDNALGDQEESQDRQIAAWLLDPQTKDALEALYFRWVNQSVAGQETDQLVKDLSVAVAKLER